MWQVPICPPAIVPQSRSTQQLPAAMHAPPQGFVVPAQSKLQVCVDESHFPTFPGCVQEVSSQHADAAMHVVPQGLRPVPQEKPQLLPSQVAVAPMGGEHAKQEIEPQ